MSMSVHSVFGIPIWNQTLEVATLETVEAAQRGERRIVYFVNTHCVNVATRDDDYLRTFRTADRVYADGSGLAIASRLCGVPLLDNVNGTDMFPLLCEMAAQKDVSVALLGAKPGIAAQCAEKMSARFPGLKFAFVEDGYFDRAKESELIERLDTSGAGMLLVAFGVPLQELWIHRHAASLKIPVLLAVGGLFDFYSGRRVRAPKILRKTGLEWIFRLLQEPHRLFGRYILGNPLFLARTFLMRLKGKKYISESIHLFSANQQK